MIRCQPSPSVPPEYLPQKYTAPKLFRGTMTNAFRKRTSRVDNTAKPNIPHSPLRTSSAHVVSKPPNNQLARAPQNTRKFPHILISSYRVNDTIFSNICQK